jgi:hypothetical protein
VCFVQNGGRLARDANGGPGGRTNFEIKIHKSLGGRLHLFYAFINEYILVFIYSVIESGTRSLNKLNNFAVRIYMTQREIHNNTINLSNRLLRRVKKAVLPWVRTKIYSVSQNSWIKFRVRFP